MSQDSINNRGGKLSLIKNLMLIFIYLQSQYSLGKWMSQDSMNSCRGKLSLIKNTMLIFIYLQSQYSLGKWMSQDYMNNCRGKLCLIKNNMLNFIYLQSHILWGSEWVKTAWIIAEENSLWLKTLFWFSSISVPKFSGELNESRLHK